MNETAGITVRGSDGRLYLVREDGVEAVDTAPPAPQALAAAASRPGPDDAAALLWVTASPSRSPRAADDATALVMATASPSRSPRATDDAAALLWVTASPSRSPRASDDAAAYVAATASPSRTQRDAAR